MIRRAVPRVAVVRLPGMNCEDETVRALGHAGLAPEIVGWDEPPSRLEGYDAYVLPGGFSYQDRVRAGAVAAKDPRVEVVAHRVEKGARLEAPPDRHAVMREGALERIAQDRDQAHRRQSRRDARGCTVVRHVARRSLSTDERRVGAREVPLQIGVEPLREACLAREEVELLLRRHVDGGMRRQIAKERRGRALLRADHEEVGQGHGREVLLGTNS